MIAPALHFIYRGGGRDDIPNHVTHFTIDPSITVIPANLFYDHPHPNIVELICHKNVKRIGLNAFFDCPRLKRVVMNGVEEVQACAFGECRALSHVECNELKIVGAGAFSHCQSLTSINLRAARIVDHSAFDNCEAMKGVTFGKDLESIGLCAFVQCPSLELITIPLRGMRMFDAFDWCVNLNSVGLVDGDVLDETIAALLFDDWRNDMIVEIESIFHNLQGGDEDGTSKTLMIKDWTERVLRKIIEYKARHRGLLNAIETSPSLAGLPDDVVRNHVLPYLKLPSYAFDGEDKNVVINPNRAELAWTRALVWPTVTESDVTAAEVDTIDEWGNKDPLVIFFVVMVAISASAKNLHVSDIIALMIIYRMNLINIETFL